MKGHALIPTIFLLCEDSSLRSRNATDSARVQEAARAQEAASARNKDTSVPKVDTSIERHVNSVLESPANQALAVPDDYNE